MSGPRRDDYLAHMREATQRVGGYLGIVWETAIRALPELLAQLDALRA